MKLTSIPKTALRTGAQAAGIGAAVLERAAGRLRTLAGGDDERTTSVDVTRPGGATRVPVEGGERPSTPSKASGRAPAATAPAAATSRPTPRPARISNPKRARAVRGRAAAANLDELEAPGASGRGGTPATVTAENTPRARAARGAGREAAPMGSEDRRED